MLRGFALLQVVILILLPLVSMATPAQNTLPHQSSDAHQQQTVAQVNGAQLTQNEHDCCEMKICLCGDECQCDSSQLNTIKPTKMAGLVSHTPVNQTYRSLNLAKITSSTDNLYRPPISNQT